LACTDVHVATIDVFPDRVGKPLAKHSLLLSTHAVWQDGRHALSPLFTSRAIANSGYDTTMPAAIARLVGELHRTVGSPRGTDIYQLVADHVLHEMVYHTMGIQISDAAEIQSSIAEAKKSKTYHIHTSGHSSNSTGLGSSRTSGTNNNLSSPVTPVTPQTPSTTGTASGPPSLSRSKSRALPALPRHPIANATSSTAELLRPLGTTDRILHTLPHVLLLPLYCVPAVRRAMTRWKHHKYNVEQSIIRAWQLHRDGQKQPFKGMAILYIHYSPCSCVIIDVYDM
jgi:hypothetical protein